MANYLQGKKTYILAGLAIIIMVLAHIGVLDTTSANVILPYLGFGSIIALRAAIS